MPEILRQLGEEVKVLQSVRSAFEQSFPYSAAEDPVTRYTENLERHELWKAVKGRFMELCIGMGQMDITPRVFVKETVESLSKTAQESA